jgi:hypothetical protein
VKRRPPVSQRTEQGLRCATGRARILLVALAATTVSGCAQRGAPSFVFFGAFFPDWMLLSGIGILAAIGTRVVLIAAGLTEVMPLQLLVCVSVGLTIATFTWLLWFGT